MLIINCKNYTEVATAPKIRKLIKTADSAAAKLGVEIYVAPPQHMIGVAAEEAVSMAKKRASASTAHQRHRVHIISQHADVQSAGSTTGYVISELLKKVKVRGSIINHSEHKIEPDDIELTIKKLRDAKMTSILCVPDIVELKKYAPFGPDYVAIEPPELIGSGKAVSTEKPEIISGAAEAMSELLRARTSPRESTATPTTHTRPQLLCGAGVVSGDDVAKAMELGSSGILVASGIIKKGPTQWEKAITDLAGPLSDANRVLASSDTILKHDALHRARMKSTRRRRMGARDAKKHLLSATKALKSRRRYLDAKLSDGNRKGNNRAHGE